ncbi:MAG: alanine racemase [Acidimicrobiia bacterium]|nr:alanine racemase [Acidimicrobiia bacterium]MDH3398365.1 alanine racemase [Acidimicrobiia bacterium]MDH5615284.1 alanine racemase [Acidimicrobiia bacterium]
MVRPSWVEIDLGAIAHNVRLLAGIAAPARLCAVVKADAYGHGDVPVAEAALEAGAPMLAVALVEEAIRLREAGIDAPVLLLSEPPEQSAEEVVKWDLIPTVYTAGFVRALSEATQRPLRIHLKVDTGMHRVGATIADAKDLVATIVADKLLDLEGVWTHFAVAEEDGVFTRHQLETFNGFVETLRRVGVEVPVRHAANTAATLLYPEARLDLVRVGIGIYGQRPAPGMVPDLDLRPAMRVVSHVSMVRRHPAGTRPSYGRRKALPGDATVATVPVGYADGLPRALGAHGGDVLIRGRRHPLAGTVTMDQVMVDVGDDPVEVGDEVVLLGSQGIEEVTADQWAEHLDTISYEVVCQIGPRLPRRYVP